MPTIGGGDLPCALGGEETATCGALGCVCRPRARHRSVAPTTDEHADGTTTSSSCVAHAAFATRAYGQEQSVIGPRPGRRREPEPGREARRPESWRPSRTCSRPGARRGRAGRGHPRGAGRRAWASRSATTRSMSTLYDDPRRLVPSRSADASIRARGEIVAGRRRGLRAERGDAPAQALLPLGRRHPPRGPLDRAGAHRVARGPGARRPATATGAPTFRATGGATDVVASAEPPPPALDTSAASVEEAHWPPPRIREHLEGGRAGGGRMGGARRAVDAQGAGSRCGRPLGVSTGRSCGRTRSAPTRRSCSSRWTLRQLDLDMEAGVEDPEPLTGPARRRAHPAGSCRLPARSRPRSTARSRPSTATTG